MRAEVNETETKKQQKTASMKQKACTKHLARFIEKKERTQINKIRNEKGKVTKDCKRLL